MMVQDGSGCAIVPHIPLWQVGESQKGVPEAVVFKLGEVDGGLGGGSHAEVETALLMGEGLTDTFQLIAREPSVLSVLMGGA